MTPPSMPRRPRRIFAGSPARECLRVLAALTVLVVAMLVTRRAEAYPWMIRHDYSSCSTCHTDPSGGGLLNAFGRSQVSQLLRSSYGTPNDEKNDATLWGAVPLPPWMQTGASVRVLDFANKQGGAKLKNELILMQADLRAEINLSGFRANGSIGFLNLGGSPAAVVSSEGASLVSREHWLGYGFAGDSVLVRAGRIQVPFGIRSLEHTLFVRRVTRTDLNDTQQHGVAVAYDGDKLRGELMVIAGNYQIKPDRFRERGYSGYVEYAAADRMAIGVSSLVTHASEDFYLLLENTRMAHGGFARYAPVKLLVLMAEVDYVGQSLAGQSRWNGVASMLQADLEPWQGVHFIGTGETYTSGGPFSATSWSGWGSVAWFFAPHQDARVDFLHQVQASGSNKTNLDALMVQYHLYL